MISESKFYGASKDVSLSANYSVDQRVARLWSFTPTASGYKVILPNPTGLKLGGLYFILVNHHATFSFIVTDHDDNTITTVDAQEGCLISLSETEFTISPTMSTAMSPGATILVGKWGLLGLPMTYTGGGGAPSVFAYWNYKIFGLNTSESFKTPRYYLFGGAGDLTGCDEFNGSTYTAKADIPSDVSKSWCFTPTLHYIVVLVEGTKDSVYFFKPTENTWIDQGAPPFNHDHGAAFCIKGVGYVVCGNDSRSMESFWGGTWTKRRDFQEWSIGCSAGSNDDKGFFTKGFFGANNPDNEHFEYSPSTDTWTQRDDVPGTLRYDHASFYIHDVGVYYIAGGIDSGSVIQDDVAGWVQSTDTWTAKKVLPAARTRGAGASGHFPGGGLGQLGFYFCGYNVTSHDDVYQYSANAPSDWWTTAPLAPANKNKPCSSWAGV